MTKSSLITVLSLLFSISGYCYDWRYVPGKKVYHDLNEALNAKEKAYNLELFNTALDINSLKKIGKLDSLQFLDMSTCYLKNLPDEIFKHSYRC